MQVYHTEENIQGRKLLCICSDLVNCEFSQRLMKSELYIVRFAACNTGISSYYTQNTAEFSFQPQNIPLKYFAVYGMQ